MTQLRENIVGIDAAIFMHPTTWKASGHVDSFSDPMIDNKDSNKRYRVDHLIEGFAEYAKMHPEAYLIIGAGKHPKLGGDEQYEEEYARIKIKAGKLLSSQQFRWEGFIKESEITVYYSASDLSIYPYTTALSSSGPMSFAIGYDKPFLVSTAFENILNEYPQLLFERRSHDLAKRLAYFFSHRNKYELVSNELRQKRNWAYVGSRTLQLYGESEKGTYEAEKSVTTG